MQHANMRGAPLHEATQEEEGECSEQTMCAVSVLFSYELKEKEEEKKEMNNNCYEKKQAYLPHVGGEGATSCKSINSIGVNPPSPVASACGIITPTQIATSTTTNIVTRWICGNLRARSSQNFAHISDDVIKPVC